MSEDEFWFSTPAYFAARQTAYQEGYRDRWEQTRFVAFVVAKTVDSKKQIKRPADLMPFPWDEAATRKKFKKMTAEERAAQEQFDREADLIMQKYQPEQWAKYQQSKQQADGSEGLKHTIGATVRRKKPVSRRSAASPGGNPS